MIIFIWQSAYLLLKEELQIFKIFVSHLGTLCIVTIRLYLSEAVHKIFVCLKVIQNFGIFFCFPFVKTVHPIDILFYLDILLVDIIPCCLFGVYQPFGGKCGRKNKETAHEKGCDVGCVYHFTMILPLHWSVSHKEKCLIMWAFICSSLFRPWPPLCCTTRRRNHQNVKVYVSDTQYQTAVSVIWLNIYRKFSKRFMKQL